MDLVLLLQVLPLALGAAVSPTVLTVQILLMSDGPAGMARAWGLAIGRTAALVIISLGGYSLLNRLPDVDSDLSSFEEGAIALIGALALALVSLRNWRSPHESGHHNRVEERLSHIPALLLVVVGFGWQLVSVSTLALFLPALHLITSSAADDGLKTVALVELVLITSATWLGPPIYVRLKGAEATSRLQVVHDWVAARSHRISLGVTVTFSVGLAVWGIVVTAQNWP